MKTEMKYKPYIADNVRRIIAERCVNVTAVSRKAGYKGNMLSRMLCGRKIITDRDVALIAEALGVGVEALFRGIKN